MYMVSIIDFTNYSTYIVTDPTFLLHFCYIEREEKQCKYDHDLWSSMLNVAAALLEKITSFQFLVRFYLSYTTLHLDYIMSY